MNGRIEKKGYFKINLALLATILLWAPADSQVAKTIKANPGEICMLQELGAVILKSDDGPRVEIVLPADQRPEKYRSVDLQVGDIIKMFNGKSMGTAGLIDTTYSALAIGDEIMLGVRRGKNMLMLKFAKGDPKDMPSSMIVKKCPASGGEVSTEADVVKCPATGTEVSTDFVDIGILPEEKNGQILISNIISELVSAFGENQPAAGDEIIKIQSQKIKSLKEMLEIYNGLKEGETASLTVLRDKNELTLTFEKSKAGSAGPVKMIVK
jgi:C-terminal processing protease CtpA/Prc